MASVHYKFDPKNPIPHLVVINGISNDLVYYNDPASASGGKNISVQDFMEAWKQNSLLSGRITEEYSVKNSKEPLILPAVF